MKLRNRNVEKLHTDDFDALIIGGGINGAATAAALAGKGAKVALIDRGDFAGSTSMHSSNLVWGGTSPRMAPLWWQNLAPVMSGEVTPQEGLDKLAADMDNTMNRLARANVFDSYAPVLNEERDPQYWLDQEGSPKPKLDDEMPQGTTVPYDEMMEAWMAAGTR